MIKIPKDMLISKIKEKSGISDSEIESKIKDKLDQLSGLISEEGALHIIANELGVKIFDDPGKLQVKNVLAGMRNVELIGKVIRIYEVRNFERENRKGKVGSFLLGDETGIVRIVAWNDKADLLQKLKENDIVKIEQGYTKDNRGRMEVHLGDKTTLTISPPDVKDIQVKEKERLQIKDLKENQDNIELMGTIVQVFDPRFFPVDPESGRRVTEKEGVFYFNDKVVEQPSFSYVTNVFLDDGTENVRVVLWKNQTQKIFNMSDEEILKNKDLSFEEIKNNLLGKIVKFVGRTHKNEMFDRIEFIPQLVFTDPNPDEEIERLNKEIEKAVETEEVKEQPEIPSLDQEATEEKVTVEPQTPQESTESAETPVKPAEESTDASKDKPQTKPIEEQDNKETELKNIEDIDLSDLDSL